MYNLFLGLLSAAIHHSGLGCLPNIFLLSVVHARVKLVLCAMIQKFCNLEMCFCRLQFLPFTILNCNLKALWLSENQAQPMLKFQTDFDENHGQKVVTCFLLPQQAYQPESMGKGAFTLSDSVPQVTSAHLILNKKH